MAGYKGSDASEWKVGAAARRDARHALGDVHAGKTPNRKDTKRWCRGKVGREHATAVGTHAEVKGWNAIFATWQVLYCTECGRELDVYYGSKQEKPDWAK